MRRHVSGELVTYRFCSLDVEGLVHCIFTRLGGTSGEQFSSLNVGDDIGDDPSAVAQNHERIYAHLGLAPQQVATARQVHGNRVALVTANDGGAVFEATDGLITAAPGVALLLRFADCQPILLYDPKVPALGLVHAGWRGVAQGIARRAVEAMRQSFGSDPGSLLAGLGPAIGPCCYVVGDNVASAMGYALPDWRQVLQREEAGWRFDLPGANRQQLAAAGVKNIEEANFCSSCHRDEFFSHRAQEGNTGRFAVVAYLLPRGEQAGTGPRRLVRRHEGSSETAAEPAATQESLHATGFPSFEEALARIHTQSSESGPGVMSEAGRKAAEGKP